MIYLMYISLSYLAFTTIIIWMNTQDLTPLPVLKHTPENESPSVSICIPARNEEKVINRSVQSAINQDYTNLEVILLDDNSTDATPQIIASLQNQHPTLLTVLKGKAKPDNWIGKPWACHQLSEEASGDILLFIDADVWLAPDATGRIVQSIKQNNVNFLTVWPLQELGSFWEKVVIPIVYYGLLTLLPARYVHQKPGWLPRRLEKRFSVSFAAACGQCMAFKAASYNAIGGHTAVKDEIVEDVALAKRIKKNRFRMHMHHGADTVHCRMYRNRKELWEGFRKNFLALYNNSILVFVLMAIVNFVVYVLPFIFLPLAIVLGKKWLLLTSAAAAGTIVGQRFILAQWYQWDYSFAFSHPLGVLWFLLLGVRVLRDYASGILPNWKGRSIENKHHP